MADPASRRLPLEPMDPQLTSIQPGGGIIISLEKMWGTWRRWWLKTFRSGYVARMRACRQGEVNGCPHEVLDPRDLKYYRNQPNYWWKPEDDPFAWRDRLPFARVGLAELIVMVTLLFGGAIAVAVLLNLMSLTFWPKVIGWIVVLALVLLGTEILWFFRNPYRPVPMEPGQVISPADGKVVTIEDLEHDEFIGGPAVRIGIFLSIFNVHINRSPVAARVIGLSYQPGLCLNALRPESARLNERLVVKLEESAYPHRRMTVAQITGAIARRIVCWLKPGDELARGEQFGMIKLGSRTELVLPVEDGLEILSRVGDTVQAGSSVLACYRGTNSR
ncbi:phosphatidylserine decarboxylase [Planctomicrobium sp. SH664]|uniref:phosphatidylserine decarboxylase n=1 Tax=Planctomicrobium sp. SH664 TaxID=3448125 RepID=UPI003F5B1A9A